MSGPDAVMGNDVFALISVCLVNTRLCVRVNSKEFYEEIYFPSFSERRRRQLFFGIQS